MLLIIIERTQKKAVDVLYIFSHFLIYDKVPCENKIFSQCHICKLERSVHSGT